MPEQWKQMKHKSILLQSFPVTNKNNSLWYFQKYFWCSRSQRNRRKYWGGGKGGKDREWENYRIMWLKSKERFFPLLEIVKMLLAPPQCPSYEEEGRGVTWTGGSKPLLFFCYLSSPWASFQTLSWKAFETTRFSIRESFFHKCRCAA